MAGPWGGYRNGRIPLSAMVVVRQEYFQPEAGRQLLALELAFERRFGYQAIINDGYRSYAGQLDTWEIYQKGGPLAAYPGTSNHGWGMAADFGSGVNRYGSAQKAWMDANAPDYGWFPTGNNFSRKEAWHYDYLGRPIIIAGSAGEQIEEEEEEMTARPGQVHWVRSSDKKTVRALFVPGTGYWLEWQETGASIANGFARNLGTGSSTPITESMARVMRQEADAQLPKASSLSHNVTVEVQAEDVAKALQAGIQEDLATLPDKVVDKFNERLK